MIRFMRRYFNQAGSGGGNGVATIEPVGDLKTPEGLIREVGTISGLWRDLFNRGALVRTADGGYQIKAIDEVREIEKREEEILKRIENLDGIIKANASRFSGSAPEQITLSQAAMLLRFDEKGDDLSGFDRTYANVMALKAHELAGICQLSADKIPGLAPHVRSWGESPQNAATVSLVDRLHHLNDRLVMKYWWLSSSKSWRAQNADMARAMRGFREWKEYERVWKEVLGAMGIDGQRAMDETTTTKGLNLVPVQFSGSVADIVELQLRVAAVLRSFTMTRKTFEWPIKTGHTLVFTQPESAFDHATYGTAGTDFITASNPTWGKPAWTTGKLAGLVWVSTESSEDAIEDGVGLVIEDMGMALGINKEDAFINGEKGAATMDGATFNPATQIAGNQRRWINGLRFHALMTGSYPAALDMSNGAVTEAKAIDLQDAMGVWGVDPNDFVWIPGFKAYHSIRKLANYMTLDKIGNLAVNIRGVVGIFLGSPVVLTEKLTLMQATGKYGDGTGLTRGSLLGVKPSRWFYGDRRVIQVDQSEHAGFIYDQVAVRGTLRGDLQPLDTPSATVTPVGIIYNIGA